MLVCIKIRPTLAMAALRLPNLSMIYPIKRPPIISPTPRATIANIDFMNLSFSSSPGMVSVMIGTKRPVYTARLIPVQNT